MSKIYGALNEVGANPFEPSNAPLPDGIIRGTATGLRKELVEFEKLLDERVGRLRLAAAEADTAATNDSQQAARTIEKLNGEISALDTKLKETRDLLERKVVASQALERELTATVSELKTEVKSKDETLASRVSEVNALTAEVNRLRDGIRGMVSVFNQQAQALGGHLPANSRLAAFAPPAMNSAKSELAHPSALAAISEANSNEGVDTSILER
ncbi:MAG: hypothetical protein ACXWX7_08055 [Candidatus Binatia bacterium]